MTLPYILRSFQFASYQFVDNDVKNRRTYYYKLEDVDLNGTNTMHGPVSAEPQRVRSDEWGMGNSGINITARAGFALFAAFGLK